MWANISVQVLSILRVYYDFRKRNKFNASQTLNAQSKYKVSELWIKYIIWMYEDEPSGWA